MKDTIDCAKEGVSGRKSPAEVLRGGGKVCLLLYGTQFLQIYNLNTENIQMLYKFERGQVVKDKSYFSLSICISTANQIFRGG